jgi:hypothetical protein
VDRRIAGNMRLCAHVRRVGDRGANRTTRIGSRSTAISLRVLSVVRNGQVAVGGATGVCGSNISISLRVLNIARDC